tara:strand:+ start:627 stop:1187 length:561 start_codon:yes stop_codon:yes gene_type:complete
MKNCIKCLCELTEFTWSPDQRINYINKCRECIKVEKREYQKEWRKNNPEKSASAQKRHKTKLRIEDPVKSRAEAAYSDCRKRAIQHGMEFNLTPTMLLNLMRKSFTCPYLRTPLTFVQGEKANTLASVDRIDSKLGYTQDNIQIISYLANLMKSHASEEELVSFANGVLAIHYFRTIEKLQGRAAK